MKKSLLCLLALVAMGACTAAPNYPDPNAEFAKIVGSKPVYLAGELVGQFTDDARNFVVEDTVTLSITNEHKSKSSAKYEGSNAGKKLGIVFTEVDNSGGYLEQYVDGVSIGKALFTFTSGTGN